MAFGWSAGDILAALRFVVDVAQALDDVNGAPKEFRQASSFLRNLDKALAPLRTFTALEAKPEYKEDIEFQVQAIRTPIEAFMKDVEGMANRLGDTGVSKTGRPRILKNIGSKLEWHFSVSKKAIGLQKEVQEHLRIIDTLMQRLTIDMLHTLQKDMKGDIQESVTTVFNTHLSPLKSSIMAEISQHDDLSRSTWLEQLEELLERYLGSQRLVLVPSSSPLLLPQFTPTDSGRREEAPRCTKYTPEMLKENAAKVKALLIPVFPDNSLPEKIGGITADLEITHQLRLWWTTGSSDMIWIHSLPPDKQTGTSSLTIDVVAIAQEANVSVLWYVCKRLDPSGTEIQQKDLFADLVFSLIYQALEGITNSFCSELDFSTSRFDLLEESPPSVTEALSVLDDLLQINAEGSAKGIILVVLDDLQLLDYHGDSSLELHIREFLSILHGNRSMLSAKVIKTLITTEEQTIFLLDGVGPGRVVDGSTAVGSDGFFSLAEFQDRET